MLSQTVEYALRAVVHLASEAPEGRTTDQIAEATRAPCEFSAQGDLKSAAPVSLIGLRPHRATPRQISAGFEPQRWSFWPLRHSRNSW